MSDFSIVWNSYIHACDDLEKAKKENEKLKAELRKAKSDRDSYLKSKTELESQGYHYRMEKVKSINGGNLGVTSGEIGVSARWRRRAGIKEIHILDMLKYKHVTKASLFLTEEDGTAHVAHYEV